jgi:hypothetical protein
MRVPTRTRMAVATMATAILCADSLGGCGSANQAPGQDGAGGSGGGNSSVGGAAAGAAGGAAGGPGEAPGSGGQAGGGGNRGDGIGTSPGTNDAGTLQPAGGSSGEAAVSDGGLPDGQSCFEGTQQCTVGQWEQVQTCTNGQWATSSCPQFSVCVADGCLPVCDGLLASATLPSVCVFPLADGSDNGLYLWSNDAEHLSTATGAVKALVSDGQAPKPVLGHSGAGWPYDWQLSYPKDVALVAFELAAFTFPIQEATLVCKVKRANLSDATTNELFAASNGSIFGESTLTAPSDWRVDTYFVQAPSVQQLNYDGNLDFLEVTVTGDGLGDTPDALDLNWYLLQVAQ